MNRVSLFHPGADRALRRFRGADAPVTRAEDAHLYASGDERPNTGLREGVVPHAEVNEVIRGCDMSVIFGQQTRLRNGVLLADRRLPRFHAGHDIVKFFYRAIRQLPDYFVDALLDYNVSVTLVQGPDLLVFHHAREHQAFHMGRTRRTLYIPEPVLHKAFELGYDYWALTEVLIQETWPLMDYILLYELVRRLQDRFKTHLTLGYHTVKGTLRRLNHHRFDDDERDDDEQRVFFRYYHDAFFDLQRDIVDDDAFDIADRLFDEGRERFWSSVKLNNMASVYRYPAYFHIDRDIVHGAAFDNARKLAQPLEPQSATDIMHDLWVEARFKLSRSIRTEELLEWLVKLGAEGIGAFFETVAEERTYGFEYVTANRYDGYDIFTGFKGLLQRYSSSEKADVPGCIGYCVERLYAFYVNRARHRLLEQFKGQSARSQQENAFLIKQMLHRVVEHRMHSQRAPELRQQIDFSSSARFLIETGEQLLGDQDGGESEVDLQAEILARLDRHLAYHTDFLRQYRKLTGQPDVVVKQNIQPEIERLFAWLPEHPYGLTSDPQGFLARRRQFRRPA